MTSVTKRWAAGILAPFVIVAFGYTTKVMGESFIASVHDDKNLNLQASVDANAQALKKFKKEQEEAAQRRQRELLKAIEGIKQ